MGADQVPQGVGVATEGGNETRTFLLALLYLAAGVLALATLPRRPTSGEPTRAQAGSVHGRPN